MKLFHLGIAAAGLVLLAIPQPAQSNIQTFLKTLEYSKEDPPWTAQANCTNPPPFLRAGEEVDTAITGSLEFGATMWETFIRHNRDNALRNGLDYYFHGGPWSLWPTLGCLHTTANFYGKFDRVFALVRAVPTDKNSPTAPYKLLCQKCRGQLNAPKMKTGLKQIPAYFETFKTMWKMLGDTKVDVTYTFDNTCSANGNSANFIYSLKSSTEPFSHQINKIDVKRTINSVPEAMTAYMVGATHRYMSKNRKNGRHFIAAVSMSPAAKQTSCSMEFMVNFNHGHYVRPIAEYLNRHFGRNGFVMDSTASSSLGGGSSLGGNTAAGGGATSTNNLVKSTETFVYECLKQVQTQCTTDFGSPTEDN